MCQSHKTNMHRIYKVLTAREDRFSSVQFNGYVHHQWSKGRRPSSKQWWITNSNIKGCIYSTTAFHRCYRKVFYTACYHWEINSVRHSCFASFIIPSLCPSDRDIRTDRRKCTQNSHYFQQFFFNYWVLLLRSLSYFILFAFNALAWNNNTKFSLTTG